MTPRLGTDGNQIVYPVRGIVQVVRYHPQRQTLVYVAGLVATAALTAAACFGLERVAELMRLEREKWSRFVRMAGIEPE